MTPQAPQKLGRYEVLEEVGKGAMGVVYLARDPLIGRQVALKTFRVGFSAKDQELHQFRSRFVREAQSAGILSHPNIVTIHDVVDEGGDGVCFIAMEYVKGTNLKQLMQRPEPISHDFVVHIIAQIAEALDYAHSRGVVHRDIKPANILIAQDDKVKITDFGIARLDTSNLTMEGQLLGTPNYMAPEQIQGKEVDHRADIFSLGVVFYEMLTRKKPFQGENLTAVTHKIVYEPFTPPEDLVSGLPAGISAVLKRCLEKDPNRRYPRASEIASELRRSASRNAGDDDDTSATQEVAEQTSDPTLDKTVEKTVPAPGVAAPAAGRPAPPSSPAPPSPAPVAPQPSRTARDVAPGASRAPTAPINPTAPMAPVAPVAAVAAVAPVAPISPISPTAPMPSKAAVPIPPSSGQRQDPATPSRLRNQRIVWIGLLSLVLISAIAIAILWLRDSGAESPAEMAPPTAVTRPTAAQTALDEARALFGRGDFAGALLAVERAEAADPASVEAKTLRAEIEGVSHDLANAAELEQRIAEGLELAREELDKRRYEPAIAAASAVLALAPEHAEATKLRADSEAALARQKERQRAARQSAESPPPSATPAPAVPAGPVIARPVPAAPAPAGDAVLGIEFFSELSEGTLTIYAGERQIVREAFKFVRKTGFMRSEKISGTLSFERTLPSGPTSLRVYVSTPGKPTRSILLETELAGGTTPKLGVRVDGDGRATANLH